MADTAAVLPSEKTTTPADPIKDWFRANVRWVLAEIGHTKEGKSEEERAEINP